MTDETIKGQQIDLSEGRHVFVAEYKDSMLVEFVNSEGGRTRLRLSREAADALQYLLKPVSAETIVQKFLAHMVNATMETTERLQWQHVQTDTLPIAAPPEPR